MDYGLRFKTLTISQGEETRVYSFSIFEIGAPAIDKATKPIQWRNAVGARNQPLGGKRVRQARSLETIAVDGNALKEAIKQGAQDAYLLSAASHRLATVLAQVAIKDRTNEIG